LDDPEIIKLMIQFLYNLDYDESLCRKASETDQADDAKSSTLTGPQVDMLTHAKVFATAIKYQIDGLRDLAEGKFEDSIESSWDSGAFPEVITVVFHSTPAEVGQLRDIVIDTIYNHFEALKDKEEIDAAICDILHLAYALYKRKREESSLTVTPVAPVKVKDTLWCRVCSRHQAKHPFLRPTLCPRCWKTGIYR
jgi:hypothetical protein